MVSEFLAKQREKFIKQVESKIIPQPAEVAVVALIDILAYLERRDRLDGKEPAN